MLRPLPVTALALAILAAGCAADPTPPTQDAGWSALPTPTTSGAGAPSPGAPGPSSGPGTTAPSPEGPRTVVTDEALGFDDFEGPSLGVSAVELPDGRIRLYVGNGADVRSGVADGDAFEVEDGVRVPGAAHPRVVALAEGGYRMFAVTTDGQRIVSGVSQDGLSFTQEAGARLDAAAFGASSISGIDLVRAGDGWRAYLAATRGEGRVVVSATSPDMLTWTPEEGARAGPGTDAAMQCVHPGVEAEGARVELWCLDLNGFTLVRTVSDDGLAFGPSERLGGWGGHPDALRVADGGRLLFTMPNDARGFSVVVREL